MRKLLFSFLVAVALVSPASANDWEKFYNSYGPTDGLIPATTDPEVIPFSGNVEQDLEQMWRKGFVAIGYTYFNTSNSKTGDAKKLAKKLKASFLILSTDLTSSNSSSIPITTPKTTTSQTTGSANVYGTGGSAHGTYSGTTTTYGTQTNYIPVTINRFDKMAMYFMGAPKIGTGIMSRELSSEEVAKHETRRAFAVKWIRDNSPAYYADLLPNDIVLAVNGQPADGSNWQAAIASNEPLNLKIVRNGTARELVMLVPEEWQSK